MSEYTLSFLIKTLQSAIGESQETTGRIVLETGIGSTEISISIDSKMISKIVQRKAEVHNEISAVARKAANRPGQRAYVRENLMPLFSDLTIDDCCKAILDEMQGDETVSEAHIKRMERLNGDEDKTEFFLVAILYALTKGKNFREPEIESNDFHFLEEVSSQCPLCGNALIKKGKGGAVTTKYRIISIFPDDLEDEEKKRFETYKKAPRDYLSSDNRIALCRDCADEYLKETKLDFFRHLLNVKAQVVRAHRAKAAAGDTQLDEQIAEVVKAVANVDRTTELTPFTDALKLAEKIRPEFFPLQKSLEYQVVTYYPFIEKQFSILDGVPHGSSFNIISAEIKLCYERLEREGLGQEEICEDLSLWIRQRAGFGETHRTAGDIIVAFFVQNCEVFHAFAK